MDPNQEKDDLEVIFDASDDDSMSVDDFIRQLEAKEKDLHITLETTVIEIEKGFDDVNPTDFILAPPTSQKAPEVMEIKSIEPVVEESVQAPPEELIEMESKLEELSDTIAKMREERMDILTNSQRRAKDFENFKARTERERNEVLHSQAIHLATQMLPAIDNLNRALDSVTVMNRERSIEFEQFYQGIVMVNQQVNEIFAGMDILPIPTVGKRFDPHLHEAVATEESNEAEVNTISEELLKGYCIGDRVIRHSLVKVFVKPAEAVELVEYDSTDSVEADIDDEADADLLKTVASRAEEHQNDPAATVTEVSAAKENIPIILESSAGNILESNDLLD